jgi:hypothetical protein
MMASFEGGAAVAAVPAARAASSLRRRRAPDVIQRIRKIAAPMIAAVANAA